MSAPNAGRALADDTPRTPSAAVHPLDPARDEEAAAILAACTPDGTTAAGRALLAAARRDPDSTITGVVEGGTLVAVCVTRKVSMAVEVAHLAVADGRRRQGHGRACLQDALRRAGKRPLVAETDEAGLPFYRACGFKLVGRRKAPGGGARYRLGWHAPTAHPPGPMAPGRPGGRTLTPPTR